MSGFLRRLAEEHAGETPVLHPLRVSLYGERSGAGFDRPIEGRDLMGLAEDEDAVEPARNPRVIARPVVPDRAAPRFGSPETPSDLTQERAQMPDRGVAVPQAVSMAVDKAIEPVATPPRKAPVSFNTTPDRSTMRGSLDASVPAGARPPTTPVAPVSTRLDRAPARRRADPDVPAADRAVPAPPSSAPSGPPAAGPGPRARGYPPAPQLALSRPLAGPARRMPAPTPLAVEERTIEVRIGRIEIRAAQPEPARPTRRPNSRPQVSLSEYLRRREREAAG